MNLVQRTVTGIIKNALGENLAGAKIVFIPQKVFGAGNTTVPATRREVITGAGGEFSIALYTFDTGTVQYACLLPSKESFSFNLAAGASVPLETLRQISIAENSNSQGFFEDLIRVVIGQTGVSGPASGVLAGSYPSPGFAVNMATQAELDAAVGGKADTLHIHNASQISDFSATVTGNSNVTANTAARHTHANKTLLDNLISNGDGSSYLSNDGTYKPVAGGTSVGKSAVEFERAKLHQIYAGDFYKAGVEYNCSFAHAMIKPSANSQYFIADGDGGNHNLLLGTDGNMTDGFFLTGNIKPSDGGAIFSFVTTERMRGGEWAYVSFWYNKQWLILAINGVPSAAFQYIKGRKVNIGDNGSGLSAGGTDHNNFSGRCAAIGIIESELAAGLPFDLNTAIGKAAKPYIEDFAILKHNLCYDFRTGSVNDISLGFGGEKFHGELSEMNVGVTRNVRGRDKTKLPIFVTDQFAYTGAAAQKTQIAGTRIYDDFSGADSHYGITATPSLPPTRIGGKTYNGTGYGKQFGAAVSLLEFSGSKQTITDTQSDGTIIWRKPSGIIPVGRSVNYRYIFRYTDDNNYNFLYVDEYGSGFIFTIVAGAQSNLGSLSFSSNYTEAKVVLVGSNIKTYADGVLKHDLTSSANQTATGKGFELTNPLLRITEWGVI